MSEEELNPMSIGSPSNPMGGLPDQQPPVGGGAIGPIQPVDPNSGFSEGGGMDKSKIFMIVSGVLGLFLIAMIVLVVVFAGKASKTDAYVAQKVDEAKAAKEKEVQDACELEKKDIKENPWENFTARGDFGSFKFVVPRQWSKYEHFDINDNDPYSVYFSDTMVQYDSGQNIRKVHSPLEMSISKNLYDAEKGEMKQKLESDDETKNTKTEETVNISNFQGTKFTYKDKELGRIVGVIILPYRDRSILIKTDDYDKWNQKYYDKFWRSFALTR